MTSHSDTTSFTPEEPAGTRSRGWPRRRPSTVDVVVIGAGYAGVLATNRFLASLRDAERATVRLTVINPSAEFVERIRLHELAAGSRTSVTQPLPDMLHPEARLMTGAATAIDAEAQTVTVQMATGVITQRYDWLIYAPGSAASSPVPGAREHAHLIADLEGAQSAAAALSAAAPGTRVVVIGGGFTGVETAAEVAEHRSDLHVTLLSNGPILPHMRPAARRSILKTGNRLGIGFVQNASVQSISTDELQLQEGDPVGFDVCLVALSFTAPDLARVSGLEVDDTDRLRVDEALRSLTAPNIIGAGDAVVTPAAVGSHLRMGCAVALPLGGHAAQTVLHLIRNEQPEPISIGLILQCLSLGRRRGYIQFVRADDSPRRIRLVGRAGAAVKEMVSRMVVTSPRRERETPGAYRAVQGPRPSRVHAPTTRTRAGVMLASGLLLVAVFQAALAMGAPFGAAALGGIISGQLPGPLRVLAAVLAVLWLITALIVAARAGHAPVAVPRAVYKTGTTVLVGLLGVGTLLNFASPSPWERFGWGPFTLGLFALGVVLARTDQPGQPDRPDRPDQPGQPGRAGQPEAEPSHVSR